MTKIIILFTNTKSTQSKSKIYRNNWNGNLKTHANGPHVSSQQEQSQQGY
jgi:hypothetical protein